MVVLGPLNRSIPVFLMLWFTAFLFYACAVWAVFKKQSPGNSSRSLRPSALFVVAGFALVFRVVLWFSPASLSDDIYRNVWEGTIVASGMNPYLHTPDDPALAHCRDADVFSKINHRQYAAIYPPVTQFVLGISMALHPSTGCMKAVLGLFDLGCVAVIILILSACRLPLQRCIVYAWHPLPILEFAGSGHCDSIGIFFLLLCVLFLLRGLPYAGAGFLALSALAKVFPAVFVPFILARRPAAVAVCIICAVVAYAPFMDAGAQLFSSLSVYARDWYFNGSLYDLLVVCFGDRTVRPRCRSAFVCPLLRLCFPEICTCFGPASGARTSVGNIYGYCSTVAFESGDVSMVSVLDAAVSGCVSKQVLAAAECLDCCFLPGADRVYAGRPVAGAFVGQAGRVRSVLRPASL